MRQMTKLSLKHDLKSWIDCGGTIVGAAATQLEITGVHFGLPGGFGAHRALPLSLPRPRFMIMYSLGQIVAQTVHDHESQPGRPPGTARVPECGDPHGRVRVT